MGKKVLDGVLPIWHHSRMTLNQWLAERQMRPAQFAREAKVGPSTIHRILTGERKPGLSLAARIERLTDGKVTCRELAGEEAA